jgi:dihydrofolate reductase
MQRGQVQRDAEARRVDDPPEPELEQLARDGKRCRGEVAELKADQNQIVWGSPTLVQYLADHGLVDEYKLLVAPIFRGKGITLFAHASAQIDLKLVEAKLLGGGMLALHILPVRVDR